MPALNSISHVQEDPTAAVRRLEVALGVAQDVETEMVKEARALRGASEPLGPTYVEDCYSLLLTTAAVLEESRIMAVKEEDTQGVQKIDNVANDLIESIEAYYAAAHPHISVVDLVPRKSRRDTAPTTLFDVVRGFARKMPLPRILQLETDVRPYMAAVVVEALRAAGDTLVIPDDLKVRQIPAREFEDRKLDLSAKQY